MKYVACVERSQCRGEVYVQDEALFIDIGEAKDEAEARQKLEKIIANLDKTEFFSQDRYEYKVERICELAGGT